MKFDARDPYDAAALYDMWLNCHGCPQTFDFEPSRPIGLDYYHDIGQRAKVDGWLVVEQEDPEDVEGVSYLVLCPHCSERYGLNQAAAQGNARAPRVIREICQAVQRAEAGKTAA
jgi:sarcosine oxidase delta subunit